MGFIYLFFILDGFSCGLFVYLNENSKLFPVLLCAFVQDLSVVFTLSYTCCLNKICILSHVLWWQKKKTFQADATECHHVSGVRLVLLLTAPFLPNVNFRAFPPFSRVTDTGHVAVLTAAFSLDTQDFPDMEQLFLR